MKKLMFIAMMLFSVFPVIAQNTLDLVGLSSTTPSTGAYALRKLSSTYSGFAVRVRRSSDNSTQDIGFDANGNLDQTSLLAFVGSGSGFVTTWYDQSGNNRNATQTNSSLQPRIVLNGTLETQGGRASIYFNNQKLLTGNFTAFTSGFTVCEVAGVKTDVSYNTFVNKGNSNLPSPFDYYTDSYLVGNGSTFTSSSLTTRISAATGFSQWTFQGNTTNSTAYRNGLAISSTFSSPYIGDSGNPLIFGSRQDGVTSLNGWISEAITFNNSINSSNRSTIENNQGSYYTLSVASPTAISAQPSTGAQNLCVGTTATPLSVMASGTGLTYQWYRNSTASNSGGTVISGATASSYTPPTTSAGTSYYYVVVNATSSPTSITSNVSGAITVNATPGASFGNALNFDGVDDYIMAPNGVYFNGNFTIEAWVYPKSFPNWSRIIDFGNGAGNNNVLLSYTFGTSGAPGFYVGGSQFQANTTISLNTWTHIAATLNGTTATIYINGVARGTATFPVPANVTRTLNYIGKSNWGGGDPNANAIFDEIRIWNVARTQAEIAVSMNKSLSGSESGLLMYYNFDQGTAGGNNSGLNTVTDRTSNGRNGTLYNFGLNGTNSNWIASTNPNNTQLIEGGTEVGIGGSLQLSSSLTGGTWASSNTSLATINTSGQVTGLATGTVNITYTVTNAAGCSSSSSKSVTIVPAATLSAFANMEKTLFEQSFILKPPTSNSTGTFSYTSSNPAVATISGSTVTIVGQGTSTITATQASAAGYGSNSITAVLTVTKPEILGNTGKLGVTGNEYVNKNGGRGRVEGLNRFGKIINVKSAPDGKTSATAASSAREIKQSYPNSTDGLYWISNPNINGGAPLQIYADMTTDGGGWTLILTNSSSSGWTYANAILRNETAPSISTNYSIIKYADFIKKSSSGFQYMIDAGTRRSYGGIWTANGNYTFLKGDNTQTDITLNTRFGTWDYADNSIEKRMPWYTNTSAGIITTSNSATGEWWGSLVTSQTNWSPAPYIAGNCTTCASAPGIIWYWVR